MVRKRKIRIHCAGNNSTWEFEKWEERWENEKEKEKKKIEFWNIISSNGIGE